MPRSSPGPADTLVRPDHHAENSYHRECTRRGNESWPRKTETCMFRAARRADQETRRSTCQDEPSPNDPGSQGSCPTAPTPRTRRIVLSTHNADAVCPHLHKTKPYPPATTYLPH